MEPCSLSFGEGWGEAFSKNDIPPQRQLVKALTFFPDVGEASAESQRSTPNIGARGYGHVKERSFI
ncbi:MAG: hypothetical protein ABI123_05345 [Ginsengibacter sp.]